jgi:hypothetical protein
LRQPGEGGADILRTRVCHEARDGPVRQNPPPMQDDDVVVVSDFVDQMRGP